MPKRTLPLRVLPILCVNIFAASAETEDSSLAASWREGIPLWSARSHRIHVVDFSESCCLDFPPREILMDSRSGKPLSISTLSDAKDPRYTLRRFLEIRREGDLRSMVAVGNLQKTSPETSQTVQWRFTVQFSRFGAAQGGQFETQLLPLDSFRLPGHCCDGGAYDAKPCRRAADHWTLWVDPATRRGVLRSGIRTHATACDVPARFHLVDWRPVRDDSIRYHSTSTRIFEQDHAGWDAAGHRIHVGSFANLGGGYPEQEHLVIDDRSGGILETRKNPWPGSQSSDLPADSAKSMRDRTEASLFRSRLVAVRPWESVRRITAGNGVTLQGIQDGDCLRIHRNLHRKIEVSPSCCDHTSEQPTKPCHLPANDWTFWPAPVGRSGLLRAQATNPANDCNGGPVYSMETWSPSTCSDQDFLDP
ncbi:MAG TPA: hypothetical protein PKO15_03255 [Fibrobacteria bacterium]|nr:hypothetical protein [Fibrobacteria bacterium]HOX49977.1 hypothetical protein [Fibrobacteria bacterium]